MIIIIDMIYIVLIIMIVKLLHEASSGPAPCLVLPDQDGRLGVNHRGSLGIAHLLRPFERQGSI